MKLTPDQFALKLRLNELRERVNEAERKSTVSTLWWEPAGHALRKFEAELKAQHPELF